MQLGMSAMGHKRTFRFGLFPDAEPFTRGVFDVAALSRPMDVGAR